MQSSKSNEPARSQRLPQAHFLFAARQARRVTRVVFLTGTVAFLMVIVALMVTMFDPTSRWMAFLCSTAAAGVILALALHNAGRICQWRADKQSPEATPAPPEPDEPPSLIFQKMVAAIPFNFKRVDTFLKSDGINLGTMAFIALFTVLAGWGTDYTPLAESGIRWVIIGGIALTIFILLVAERHLAATGQETWPEANLLAPVLRLMMAVLFCTLPMLLFPAITSPWLINLPAILVVPVAIELILRGLFSLFRPPRNEEDEPDFLAKSRLAQLLTWPPRPLRFLQQELHQHLGIDLRQLWAFTVLRRALLPVIAVMMLCGWLLTGLQQLSADQRGIYERFGKPVAVLSPGLHAGLPWPFGQVIVTENGQVHELAAGETPDDREPLVPADAEGNAPASANRLWDATHNFDKAQIIASQSGQQQSLQIMNSDVRFMWRIGLSDDAALAAAYNSNNLAELIRSTANQVLVHQFSAMTLEGLLGAQRNDLSQRLNQAVQQRLDQLHSGVELLSTVVEAIHPPAGAADAFHGVQAAQITAQSLIFNERGHAAELTASAATTATSRRNDAQASATDVLSKAQATAVQFTAQKNAQAKAGQVYIDEQWLKKLQQTLAGRPLLIIDHHIGVGSPPTLDLREFPSLNAAAQHDTPVKPAQEPSR
ncbi:protease modulator HflK [Enterobacteriaceae bacterium RIT714]|nr:protease modulator HflK [Enterobacteriaceae bacterium RIT714]